MREKQQRILFVCVRRSIRAQIAASILAARTRGPWDVWCTPTEASQDLDLAAQVLDELGMSLIAMPQIAEPSVGLVWDEAVVLSSGAARTSLVVPGAHRHRFWEVEDVPAMHLGLEQRLQGYRRICDGLRSQIDAELLLPSLRQSLGDG